MIQLLTSLFLLIFLPVASVFAEESAVQVGIASDSDLTIGHVSSVALTLKNISNVPVIVLEIDPLQPCEDSINLMKTLYGEIDYLKDTDVYAYNSKIQTGSHIPVSEGFLFPNQERTWDIKYRPFSRKEVFVVSYAVGGGKVYARDHEAGGNMFYSPKGKDYAQVIVPRILDMPKSSVQVAVTFSKISGELSKQCYSTTLDRYVDSPPFSLYKEWDSGDAVLFQVGENQKGKGPDPKPANWKFLDLYPVSYGDGIYKQGEFVLIKPEQAPNFMEKIQGKYEIERVNYFLQNHYYALISNEE